MLRETTYLLLAGIATVLLVVLWELAGRLRDFGVRFRESLDDRQTPSRIPVYSAETLGHQEAEFANLPWMPFNRDFWATVVLLLRIVLLSAYGATIIYLL